MRPFIALILSLPAVTGHLCASEVDPWLDQALAPWRAIHTVRCTVDQSRGSIQQTAEQNPRVVSRSLRWTAITEPMGMLLEITGGPMEQPLPAVQDQPGVRLFMRLEYPADWRTGAVGYADDRMQVFRADTGVIETQRLQGDLSGPAFEGTTPLPLLPFSFLNASASDDDARPRAVLLERLRDPTWVAKQWNLLRIEAKDDGAGRRLLQGRLPEHEGGDPFEVVLERQEGSDIPIVSHLSWPYLGVSDFVYQPYPRSDGTSMPVCARSTVKGLQRDDIAVLTSLTFDEDLGLEDLAMDVSQARTVLDVDEGIEVPIDAGSP